ncbi:MAG: hypothetical protein LBG95_00360 [Treponema sp.]|jgi:hypothetical protein|nr:hypothetical protein [Treponema sp.]
MNLFCLLCIPLFFILRQTNSLGEEHSLWALPLGGLAVLAQYFIGPLTVPDGFGISRWMSGFLDITGLPALVPFIACFALVLFKVLPATVDYAGFTLLWLAPQAAIRSISGTSSPSLLSLVIVPMLWAAQAAGIAFFAVCIKRAPHKGLIFLSALCLAALPIAAATSWWAFFNHRTFLGFLFLLLSIIPAALRFSLINVSPVE